MSKIYNTTYKNRFQIVYLTALEMPSISNLHASQVFAPACAFSSFGFRVAWVAVIPVAMRIKDCILRTQRLKQVSDACSHEGIDFLPVYTPLISISHFSSFCFRKLFFSILVRKIFKILKLSNYNVIHARSYYATELACLIRSMASSHNCKVSFDMRSVFPEEMPIISSGTIGKIAFAFMKQWEFDLLRNSDVAFLPLNYARNRIYTETGTRVQYIPVQGFDREPGWSADFHNRWTHAYLGYSGALGSWHSPEILLQIFQSLSWMTPRLATKPHSMFSQYECCVYANNDMPAFYDGLLGLVIPGRQDGDDYFMSFQMRCNLFSTKAAEALSRGVPLVVSSKLFELAKFVRKNRCGFVYDPDAQEFVFPDRTSITEKAVWAEMTENAVTVGERFTRTRVVNEYLACWEALFEKDANQP